MPAASERSHSMSKVRPADELAVDLEHVDRQAVEVGERGVAGPEVVDGDADAEASDPVEDLDRPGEVVHHGALGDLAEELAWIDAVADVASARSVDERLVGELVGRQVDGEGVGGAARAELADGLHTSAG